MWSGSLHDQVFAEQCWAAVREADNEKPPLWQAAAGTADRSGQQTAKRSRKDAIAAAVALSSSSSAAGALPPFRSLPRLRALLRLAAAEAACGNALLCHEPAGKGAKASLSGAAWKAVAKALAAKVCGAHQRMNTFVFVPRLQGAGSRARCLHRLVWDLSSCAPGLCGGGLARRPVPRPQNQRALADRRRRLRRCAPQSRRRGDCGYCSFGFQSRPHRNSSSSGGARRRPCRGPVGARARAARASCRVPGRCRVRVRGEPGEPSRSCSGAAAARGAAGGRRVRGRGPRRAAAAAPRAPGAPRERDRGGRGGAAGSHR